MVRDMYTKSWSAFDRLVSVIPPGGSIGLDDKLFSFWVLHSDNGCVKKGVYRLETGTRVNEFRDLRANPRCLVESQMMGFRVGYAKLAGLQVMAPPGSDHARRLADEKKKRPTPISLMAYRTTGDGGSSATGRHAFNPYSTTLCPSKIIAIGSTANMPSVIGMIADVFNAKVYVPVGTPMLASASSAPPSPIVGPGGQEGGVGAGAGMSLTSPVVNSGLTNPSPGRLNAALGAAYLARWGWTGGQVDFETDIRSLLKKRYIASSSGSAFPAPLPLPVGPGGGATLSPIQAMGYPQPKRSGLAASFTAAAIVDDRDDGSGLGSRATTPRGPSPHPGSGGLTPPGMGFDHHGHHLGLSGGLGGQLPFQSSSGTHTPPQLQIGRSRTPTTSSQSTVHSQLSISTSTSSATAQTLTNATTAQTSPSPHSGMGASGMGGLSGLKAMESTGEEELARGLCKVSEADGDGFVVYAAILVEFCRIEGMLVRGF